MRLYVKLPNGSIFPADVKDTLAIKNFKYFCFHEYPNLNKNICFIFKGSPMTNESWFLREYKVKENDLLEIWDPDEHLKFLETKDNSSTSMMVDSQQLGAASLSHVTPVAASSLSPQPNPPLLSPQAMPTSSMPAASASMSNPPIESEIFTTEDAISFHRYFSQHQDELAELSAYFPHVAKAIHEKNFDEFAKRYPDTLTQMQLEICQEGQALPEILEENLSERSHESTEDLTTSKQSLEESMPSASTAIDSSLGKAPNLWNENKTVFPDFEGFEFRVTAQQQTGVRRGRSRGPSSLNELTVSPPEEPAISAYAPLVQQTTYKSKTTKEEKKSRPPPAVRKPYDFF